MIRRLLLGLVLMTLLAACKPIDPNWVNEAGADVEPAAEMLEPEGFIQQIHDPVIACEQDTYYIFSTGSRIPIICSQDMLVWEFCGRVFQRNPAWIREVNPDLPDIWAPDISFFNDRWHLYYAVSTFGTQESAIGLATNGTLDPADPDYEWVDLGEVLRSMYGLDAVTS